MVVVPPPPPPPLKLAILPHLVDESVDCDKMVVAVVANVHRLFCRIAGLRVW